MPLSGGSVLKHLLIVVAFAAILLSNSCGAPAPSGTDESPIDPSAEPVQEMVEGGKPITIEKGGWTFKLVPRASYSIQGEVLSKENYYGGVPGIISPCDLALVFGELYSSGLYKEIDWSQSGRWYWWRYGASFPRQDDRYIARWSSNNHIIPATPSLKKAARSAEEGDLVVLEGYLVAISANKGSQTYAWNSSLSRSDTGDGSCEVLYLTKMRIGENVYE